MRIVGFLFRFLTRPSQLHSRGERRHARLGRRRRFKHGMSPRRKVMFLLLTGLSIGSILTFLKSDNRAGTLHTQCHHSHQKQEECITITSDANMNARISSLSTTSSQKDLTMPVVVQTKTEKPLEHEGPSSTSTLEVEKLEEECQAM